MHITVNVTEVDLATVVGEHRAHVGDGDYDSHPVTLADRIAEQVARDIRAEQTTGYKDLTRRVTAATDKEIHDQVRPLVEAAIAKGVQRTNGYGEPVGQPVSMTDLVLQAARDVINKPTDRSGYGSKETLLQKMIREQVERTFAGEISAAIAEEKTKVVAAIRAKAATLIAESIKQGVGA